MKYCLKEHDSCNSLNTNEIKFGLKNEEQQRFWHCNCDQALYECLHHLNSTVSNHIGELYFNYNYRCYRSEREVKTCRQYDNHGDLGAPKRCVQYVIYLNTPVQYQWFDLPYYSGVKSAAPLFTTKPVQQARSMHNKL